MQFTTKQTAITVGAVVAIATFLMFHPSSSSAQKKRQTTTIGGDTASSFKPSHADGARTWDGLKMEEFSKAIAAFEKAMASLQLEGLADINKEVANALKNIDFKKMENDIQLALKEINLAGIKTEIENAMKEVNEVDINKEMQAAMKQMQAAMKEMKTANMQEMKAAIQAATAELESSKTEMKKAMLQATDGLKKAGEQLKKLNAGLQKMEADGLIKKGENPNVTWKNGKLYINEKEQSKEVSDRYKKYFDESTLPDGDNEL